MRCDSCVDYSSLCVRIRMQEEVIVIYDLIFFYKVFIVRTLT
jgi:hypothetical protein